MAKRFYLSTRIDRAAEAGRLLECLNAHGWQRTFDWGAGTKVPPDRYGDIALAEIAGVAEADVLIVLLPGGYGTHVEIGAAIALGKPVILHSPDHQTLETPYPCVFYHHPNVERKISEILNVEEILASLGRLVPSDG